MAPLNAESQVSAFIQNLRRNQPGFFEAGYPVTVARAPGRLDTLGGVADYSGGTVLERTIADATFVAVQPVPHEWIHLHSTAAAGLDADVRMPTGVLFPPGRPLTVHEVHEVLTTPHTRRWIAYVLGTLFLLVHDCGLPQNLVTGANIWIESTVPIGAGVSSSAALEVASCLAFASAYDLSLDGLELAALCQRVENEIAGAPCGIMDQVTSALGLRAHMLALKCQPHDILGHLPDPAGWSFFGIDSGVKHSVGGRSYTRARVAAFMALKIVQTLTGDTLGGYLCNLSAAQWDDLRPNIPASLTGSQFLARYGALPDTATKVDPSETYFVRDCAEFPIRETQRVLRVIEILRGSASTDDAMREVGDLMLESHAGYSDLLRLGSEETDLLVTLAMELGPSHGVYGAKITGGGSGGAVAILTHEEAVENVAQRIRKEYEDRTGLKTHLMTGTSEGALQLGARQFVW